MSGSPREAIEATLELIAEELGSEGYRSQAGPRLAPKARQSGPRISLPEQQMEPRRGAGGVPARRLVRIRSPVMEESAPAGRPAEVTHFYGSPLPCSSRFRTARTMRNGMQSTPPAAPKSPEAGDHPRTGIAVVRADGRSGRGPARVRSDSNLASVIQYAVATGHSDAARERFRQPRTEQRPFRGNFWRRCGRTESRPLTAML